MKIKITPIKCSKWVKISGGDAYSYLMRTENFKIFIHYRLIN